MVTKWDEDYLALAEFWAKRKSKDPSTRTGAVIVRPDNTIVSLGYNGFPKGMDDNPDLYENREIKLQRIVHCEMNAIISARADLTGCTLYTWPLLSCPRCAVHVIQAGITRVVGPKCPTHMLERWEELLIESKSYFKEAKVEYVELG